MRRRTRRRRGATTAAAAREHVQSERRGRPPGRTGDDRRRPSRGAAHLAVASTLAAKGRVAEAERVLFNVLRARPNDAGARWLLRQIREPSGAVPGRGPPKTKATPKPPQPEPEVPLEELFARLKGAPEPPGGRRVAELMKRLDREMGERETPMLVGVGPRAADGPRARARPPRGGRERRDAERPRRRAREEESAAGGGAAAGTWRCVLIRAGPRARTFPGDCESLRPPPLAFNPDAHTSTKAFQLRF